MRPWSVCLHVAKPTRYSSSGIEIATSSPLMTGLGSCDCGISQTLFSASANVLCATGVEGVEEEGKGGLSCKQDQGMIMFVEVSLVVVMAETKPEQST
ncbi:hypothetical protein A2U01_0027869 [Trifolium medium]|uniref:Uncharacterized protein n=1 Tax=Trifolium medium TaxID=97028 RepID=A0A392P458_9FABA|nr:hypothetical protein [Trifolium medium]